MFSKPTGVITKYCDEYVCVSVSQDISGTTRDLCQFLCMLPMSVARSSSDTLTIGCIACRREGGDVSAQRDRSVIYDCLVYILVEIDSILEVILL